MLVKVSLLTFVPAFNREKTKRMEKETLTDREVLLLRRKLDLLLRTGKLLMESAADTNRIERNMKRVAAFMGIPEEKLHLDIRWTMIMVNVSDETHSFSKFQKCEKHGINMTTITEVSHLSWKAIEQDYSLDPVSYTHLDVYKRQPFIYSKISDSNSVISGSDYIIAVADFVIAAIDYRIFRVSVPNFGGRNRAYQKKSLHLPPNRFLSLIHI